MKYYIKVALLVLVLFFVSPHALAKANDTLNLTREEQQWLNSNKNRVFILGIDPHSGIEFFKYKNEEKGYLIPLIKIINKDLNVNIKIEYSKNWGQVYAGLQNGSVDILLGANDTAERRKIMAFTQPVNRNAYAMIAKKDGTIHTIGDIDKKTIGFMKNDYIIDLLPKVYKNIRYNMKIYPSQEEGVAAVKNNKIDAFIMPGGPVVYDYIYRFPSLAYAFKIYAITSDMTFSTRIEDKILANILDKEIEHLEKNGLDKVISQSEIEYYLKIMNLTDKELKWLKNDGKAVMGITKDYLPFDYYENGSYKGISGEIINDISQKTGIKFVYDYDDFDDLSNKLIKDKIDILNIAKTDERMKYIIYPRPYSTERDIIIGKKNSKDVRDIFGLEGKRVAVIKGFWHYEHLEKNLTNVHIIQTNSIQESLKLVHEGKADYLIENPTVARYYIEELQLYDLVERGTTSTDSYLYYGIAKNKPELASIINKVLPLLDIQELTRKGYEGVPHISNSEYYKRYVVATIILVILLSMVILCTIKLIRDLIKEKTESELLRQREHYLYIDTLTLVYNRNYFVRKVENTLDSRKFPQTVIVTDMNNLKKVNDEYGHYAGDLLLKQFADILKETCPQNSLIFRMGGDEFHIILEETDETKALEVVNNINRNISNKKCIIDEGLNVYANAAFGFATRYSSNEDYNHLVSLADKRMYVDKSNRKGQTP